MFRSSSYRSQCPRGSHSVSEEQEQETSFFGKDTAGPRAQSGSTPFFQAKLSVGQPGDRYEQEADAVADKVVQQRSAGPVVQQKEISSIQRLASSKEEEKLGTNEERMRRDKEIQTKPEIQRKCAACEKEEEGAVQKKEGGGHTAAASSALSSQITNSAGKGQALPRGTLGEMQSSFGTDFSHVNIHTGSDAQQMNDQLGAQAFTHGSDIYFNSGKYNPETSQGKHLLAHELTHVVQQQGGKSIQRSPDIMMYREKTAFRFNAKHPEATDTMKEEEFTNSKKQPWLEKISVHFDKVKIGTGGETIPVGTLKGTYNKNESKAKDFSHSVTGGSSKIKFGTNGTGYTVHRIEGAGYNENWEADGKGPNNHYDKNVGGGSMSYAVFFNKKEAIHAGDVNEGSHACVHVDWNKWTLIRRINFHSVAEKTKVDVSYDEKVEKRICCDRRKQQKIKDKDVLPKPCNNVKPSECKGSGGKKTSQVCVPSNIVLAAYGLEEPTSTNAGYQPDEYGSYDSTLTGLKLNDGLYYGTWDKRPRVHELQERLTLKGFYAKSDGMFGPKTLAALNMFQESNLLPALDFVDPETARLLENDHTPASCPPGYMPAPVDLLA